MDINETINKIDKILDSEGIASIEINNKKYEITGYSVVGGYIILYFGEDNLGTFHIRDIKKVKKLF